MKFNQDNLEFFLSKRLSSRTVQQQYNRAITSFCCKVSNCTNDSTELKRHMEAHISSLPPHQRDAVGAALHAFFEFLTNERFSRRHRPDDYASNEIIDTEIAAFRTYLNSNTFLAKATIDSTISTVHHFLCFTFSNGRVDLSAIDEHRALNFLFIDKKHLKTAAKKTLATRLRTYARYLVEQGHDNARRILDLPLTMPNWSQASVPKTLSPAQVEKIKSAALKSKRASFRNAALVACLANLGLRTCEVAALKLDDIDFCEGALTIRGIKSGIVRTLPLDRETGLAIEKYVTEERPHLSGILFLRHLHNTGTPMGVANLRMTVRTIAHRAGIAPFGLHMFRHTVASRMVNGGIPLKVIADVLGHEAIQTATIYTKVDDVHLRAVCTLWPGDDDE